jgi:hypothetical protein
MDDTEVQVALGAFGGLRPTRDVLSRRVGDESVLVDVSTNRIFSLNETGARLWDLLQEGLEPAEAFARLRAEFDVAERELLAEITSFCALLERERLVSRSSA